MPNDWNNPARDPSSLEQLAKIQARHNEALGLIPPSAPPSPQVMLQEPPVAANITEEIKALRRRVYELEMTNANLRERMINLEHIIGL